VGAQFASLNIADQVAKNRRGLIAAKQRQIIQIQRAQVQIDNWPVAPP
jgi:hypothetical protein